MKRLLLLFFAIATGALLSPFINNPAALAQTNTFCAANLPCTVTAAWSFASAKFSGAVLMGAGPIFDVTAPPYNADPTGVADSTTAIQSAITAAAGRWVYVPAGTYKTTAQLLYNLQNASAYSPGFKMYGDGGPNGTSISIIKPTAALTNACALYLDGVESGNTFFYQKGASIIDISFDGSTVGANACGIKIEGNWHPKLDHVRVFNFTGDGILFPSRTDISANPDAYGTNFANISNSSIENNGGWGINQQDGPEGDHTAQNNNIIKNVLGGIRFNGEESRIIGNAIAFNGYHQASNAQGVGILLDMAPNAIGNGDTMVIEDNEFDSNLLADILAIRSVGLRVGQNRFLSHYNIVAIDNLVHPMTHMLLDGDVSLVSSFDILANRHLSARRADASSPFNASLTAHLIRGVNVTGGVLDHPFVTGNNSPNMVKYASGGGALISVTTSGGVIQNTAQVLNPGLYAVAPTISFDATAGSGGVATATLGTVPWYIQVTNPGSGYISAPSVVFNGGTCTTTPVASAIITPSTNSNSIVSEVRITTYGNCSVAPTSISFSGGGGSLAAATGFYSTGVVSINVSNGGSGYPSVVGVVVTPLAGNTDASFSANSQIDLLDRNNSGQDFIGNNLVMMQQKTIEFCNGAIPCTADRGMSQDADALTIDVGSGVLRDTTGGLKDSFHKFIETSATTSVAGQDNCYGDSTLHMNKCSYNGVGFFPTPQTGNTAGTHSDSGFFQTASAAGCTTAASIGGVCATPITITWPTAFADANYKVTCTPSGAATNLPSAPYLVTPTAASATINYFAITAAAASWPNVTCTAVHN